MSCWNCDPKSDKVALVPVPIGSAGQYFLMSDAMGPEGVNEVFRILKDSVEEQGVTDIRFFAGWYGKPPEKESPNEPV